MGRALRVTSVVVALCILQFYTLPCFAAGDVGLPKEMKVTTNDPEFIPLSDEQAITKGVKWYWYVLGAVGLLGIAAAAGGGGGGGGGGAAGTTTGSVTGSW